MNDMQLRLRCVEMASTVVPKDEVIGYAEGLYQFITQGAWGSSSRPVRDRCTEYSASGDEVAHHPV